MTTAGADRSRDVYLQSVAAMGTVVTIQVGVRGSTPAEPAERPSRIERALEWFARVEACCSRFEPTSEVAQLANQVGRPVPTSEMLYEAVQFALAVAKESGGAFDPTVGHRMESRGFDQNYRTGQIVRTAARPNADAVSYRDVHLDPERRTITLWRPLMLDLGAVAKGLAIDMAARELRPLEHFAIDAGGDLYVSGRNPDDKPWAVGIRHPRDASRLIATLRVSDAAVCTSGDYERRSAGDGGHHILDARSGRSADRAASATVVAPTAMAADALATAAFVLGPVDGVRWLERQGVEGLIVSPALEKYTTAGMRFDDPFGHDATTGT